jgi:hypothetical protein
MAIKEFITLEGVEAVKAKLAELNTAGENSLNIFRNLGSAGAGGDGFKTLIDNAKSAGIELDNTGRHANVLREAIHALHPILQIAGARMGELGSFARLAGASLPALATAAGGALVIALASLEDAAKRTQGRLQDLFGGSGTAGAQAFKALETAAKSLGTTVENVAPGFESLKTAVDRFVQSTQGFKFVALRPEDLPTGSAQSIKTLTDAYENFLKVLRAGRLDQATAGTTAKTFFDALKEGGKLTADILKQLPSGSITLLADALGKGKISAEAFIAQVALAPIPINKLVEGLSRFGPQAQAAFDTNAIQTFGDAFARIVTTLSEGFKSISGISFSKALVDTLNDFRSGLEQTIAQISNIITKLKEAAAFKVGGVPILTITFDEPKKEDVKKTIDNTISLVQAGFKSVPDADKADIGALIKVEPGSIADQIQKGLSGASIVLPTEATAALVEQFKKTGVAGGQALQEGAAQAPLDPTVFFANVTSQITSIAQSWWSSIQAVFSNPIQLQFQSNPFLAQQPTSLAGGGQVRGAGTTTSDSIMAWLSDMEYVINARAVRHYGADLFGALNAMALPKDFMNRFAMGGLARSAGNRFASGGQVSSGNSVTLKIDRHIFNMTAGDDTVAAIKRFAVAAQISSTGRKPRFVR